MTIELVAPETVLLEPVVLEPALLEPELLEPVSTRTGPHWPSIALPPVTLRSALRFVTVSVLLSFGVLAALILRPYIGHAASAVSHPQLRWLALAVLAELASMAAFARMQNGMLRAGGIRVSEWKMTSLTYAANAVSVSLPAGSALSTGYTFKRLRTWGASVPLASFVLIASGVLSTLSFGVIALLAGGFAGVQQSSPYALVAGAVVAGGAFLLVRWLVRHPNGVIHAAEQVLVLINRLLRREPLAGQDRVRGIINELRHIRPTKRDWFSGLSFALINWVADLACLIACCQAVGISKTSLVLAVVAYVAGMTVSSVSFLPGGFGVVDTAMILTLNHGGLSAVSATAAVLLYRLISVVFVVALGWVLWLGWWTNDRRTAHRPAVDAMVTVSLTADAPVSTEPDLRSDSRSDSLSEPRPEPRSQLESEQPQSPSRPGRRSCCRGRSSVKSIAKSTVVPVPEGGGRRPATGRATRRHRPWHPRPSAADVVDRGAKTTNNPGPRPGS